MKVRFLALLAACTVLGWLAWTTATSSARPMPASSDSTGFTDQGFVTGVGQAGMTEVESGEYTQSKSSNAGVKDFGAMMVRQHTELGHQLEKLAKKQGFTFPTGVGADNQQMLDALAPLSGGAFDTLYVNDMVSAHQGAVSLFEQATKDAKDRELRDWAKRTLPEIKMHLRKAEELKAKLQ